jgi:hypothetical protein
MFYHTAMATTDATAPKMCSKCKKNPKAGDEKDANPWCQACRTEYQRSRNETLEWRAERRGLIRGILAMRQEVANYFRRWGGRPFMGAEVASVVEELPGPQVAPEKAETTVATP